MVSPLDAKAIPNDIRKTAEEFVVFEGMGGPIIQYAVELVLLAERTAQAERIAELERERDGIEQDYLRRHKDAVDRFEENALLTAEVMTLREALESIAANTCCDRCQEAALVAAAALRAKEP